MGMLTGRHIMQNVKNGKININPFNEAHVGPNSYDVTLHNELLTYKLEPGEVLDMDKEYEMNKIIIPDEGYMLEPGILYLGRTVEYFHSDYFIPGIEGRSSIGRLGIDIHSTAGFGDLGWKGTWTLEISVKQLVKIKPFRRIGQVYFHEPSGDTSIKYNGKYQDQLDIEPSKVRLDTDK